MVFEKEISEIEPEESRLPAVCEKSDFAEGVKDNKKVDIGSIAIKVISVICALLCLVIFSNGATFVKSAISSSNSIMGGLFGSTSAGFPAEFYYGLHYAFMGMGVAFSGILIILGFKK
jgi:phosphate/sulfate permease